MNYTIKKDKLNNDVLVIGKKQIPLNKKNTSIEYQQKIYDNCCNDSYYSALQIKDGLYILKEENVNEYCYKIIDKSVKTMIKDYIDSRYEISLSYNSRYIVVSQKEYACPIINAIAGYDINKKKFIDCSNYRTNIELIDAVVKYRRCMYDVIASILTNQILMNDQQRLFSFLSFITNQRVSEHNYSLIAPLVKDYIYHNYPELKGMTIYTDQKNINYLNELYGINKFVFRKIDYDITGLTYHKSKTLMKK